MKNFILLMGFSFFVISCSDYNVKTVLNEKDQIKEKNNIVVLLRISRKSLIKKEEYLNNIKNWNSGYSKKANIVFSDSQNENLELYSDEGDRFYQISAANEFLDYKATGIVKKYIADNRSDLSEVMNINNSEVLVIYEIDSTISTSMQEMEFSSMITVLSKSLEVLYIDHQYNYYNDTSFSKSNMKLELLNTISGRFFKKMADFGYIALK